MIRFVRVPEPIALTNQRGIELPKVRAIAAKRHPLASEIMGYQVAKQALREMQGPKCCYCEKTLEGPRDDVEHYRPKAHATRGPGLPDHGYWWLAWTWSNLLFACGRCNQGFKKTQFPLAEHSVALVAEQEPPGEERALLIDPCLVDPIDHIRFRQEKGGRWRPVPRDGSPMGETTIQVTGLARPELLDQYREHVNLHVRPRVERVRDAMQRERPGQGRSVFEAWSTMLRELLRRPRPFVGLSYDAIDQLIPAREREEWRLELPRPPLT